MINNVAKTIKNETNEKSGGFFKIILFILSASLLGYMLVVKGKRVIRANKGTISMRQDF